MPIYNMASGTIKKGLSGLTLVGSSSASASSWATVTGVNAKKSLGKLVLLIATISNNEFSMIIPTINLESSFIPLFRTGDAGAHVRFKYVANAGGGTIQLEEFTVDGVEYNTNPNTNLVVYIFN